MLNLEHVKWSLPNGENIIKDVTLNIDEKKLIVVTGPNGGGKTTLAKLIAGVEMPQSGKIFFDGQDITQTDITTRARLGIAYAFQQPVRFKGITVRDMLELAAGKSLCHGEICELLSKVGLCADEYVDRELSASLSGGESKRIEIASVLARSAKLSVFDEPEAGIDLWSFQNLIQVFERMRKNNNGSILIISHQERILNIADEIVVIADGKIVKQGTREEIMPEIMGTAAAVGVCSGFTGNDGKEDQ